MNFKAWSFFLCLSISMAVMSCQKSESPKETIPSSPTELTANVISPTQVDLSWKDNAKNETGYKIERKLSSENSFSVIASVLADFTSYSDKSVALNTTYTYRVYAFNQVGNSTGYSNEATIKTINVPTLTTSSLTNISSSGVTTGGVISSDGGSPITASGVVWDTAPKPTIALNTKTNDGPVTGAFNSIITGLQVSTKYFVRAYATNNAGTSYGEELSFTTSAVPPTLTTSVVSQISSNSAILNSAITSDGGATVTRRGVVWATTSNPTIALSSKTSNGGGVGSFESVIKGINPSTKYYVRAYATNSAGTSYGNERSFTSTPTFSFSTVVGANGRIWMDRNLGAAKVATSDTDEDSYGDYYQWGRGADGHQYITSTNTNVLSTTDVPANSSFITLAGDWRSPPNDNLWQGVNGINNPCPPGYRLPTEQEWREEMASWSSQDFRGAFASKLKLPRAGYRLSSGFFFNGGSSGNYWSSTASSITNFSLAFRLSFAGGIARVLTEERSAGSCVRCIKD